MSVRDAALASAGLISNETWGKFENGKIDITKTVRVGIARAFGWDQDWPENPPAVPRLVIDELRYDNANLRNEVASLRDDVATMARLFEEFLRTARRADRDD